MSEPILTRLQVAAIRENTERFIKQEGGDTTKLMPMLPKRLLVMIETIEQLRENNDRLQQRS